ncbi:hypothetical protein RF11_05582 [Thelohanellus kitauei]|uniref:ISXO2-like transposase domain-containing protein n=1 Tax=Thelohanellus kitauei TaxID=669202 RepID=A0A0C2I5U4_THEKT|nr:hypothetical protein RF11_05582 [Thelohanellus kitauei]
MLFRRLMSIDHEFEDMIIGGPGDIVEIYECKLGKNKHHRGHPVNEVWVLGGVERTRQRKLFLVEVPDRTANTLLSIISTHILPGSTIITDCFRSACTNTVEGTWNALKIKIAPRNRKKSVVEE